MYSRLSKVWSQTRQDTQTRSLWTHYHGCIHGWYYNVNRLLNKTHSSLKQKSIIAHMKISCSATQTSKHYYYTDSKVTVSVEYTSRPVLKAVYSSVISMNEKSKKQKSAQTEMKWEWQSFQTIVGLQTTHCHCIRSIFRYIVWSVVCLTLSTPAVPNCYCLKRSAPYWSNTPSFDFWHSARVPECQKSKLVA